MLNRFVLVKFQDVQKSFPTGHEDFVHDVAYDYYGKRLATCSSDKKIKIWSKNDTGEWFLESTLEGQTGPVWKVAWAHPVFGQVIASCSSDKTVTIWEEQINPDTEKVGWTQRAKLMESLQSVHSIQFAPKHLGLKIATASSDGFVRVYAAENALDVAHWQVEHKFLVSRTAAGKTSEGADAVMMTAGSGFSQASDLGGSKKRDEEEEDGERASEIEGPTCLSWNQSQFDIPMIVVGTSVGSCQVWCYNKSFRQWQCVESLVPRQRGPVHDVSWAPRLGRSYHLIAAGSQDKSVRIWKISATGTLKVERSWEKKDHDAEVWSVEWNVTGTVLASTGDDSAVRLWKMTPSGDIVCQQSFGVASDSR